MKKRLGLIIAAVLLLGTGCSSVDTAPDELSLHYKGGAVSDQKFEECVQPGKHVFNGPGDKHYTYPIGQRTYRFDNANTGAESGAISIVSSDLVEMAVEGSATFNFTSDCKLVREFHEKIGNKFRKQYPDGGTNGWWRAVLESYVKQSLDRAMDASAKGLTFRDLYANPDAKKQWETAVAEMAPQFIEGLAGGPYFSDFRLNLQVPQPPADIKKGFTDRQASVEQNEAQKARNEQIRTTLEGLKAECDALGKEACMQKYAIDSGKVGQVIIAPQGAGVNVGTK